ncbi:MAG TPA: ABC transporter substrate-binding protein [Myxococcaceae bacterium]|nr:ABC transporter substrate-binding protein [Myxococcaceae bacterium]
MNHRSLVGRLGWIGFCSALLIAPVIGCKKSEAERRNAPLRLGFFPNITHAQALVGNDEGNFARELGEMKLDVKQFNVGPAAMEALSSGSLDITYVGPGPAINTFLKAGRQLRVIAGAVNGGAVFVAKTARSAQDLKGKIVASPQIGNSQDIALRYWLKTQGLTIADDSKGDVRVMPIPNPDILSLFISGRLEAGWVPEPWGARLIVEGGGHLLVDERDLWSNRSFPATVVVTTAQVLQTRPEQVAAILRAHAELTRQWQANPDAFAGKANDAFAKLTGKKLSPEVLKQAFSRIEPTVQPLPEAMAQTAHHAQQLGYVPNADLTGMIDTSILTSVLSSAKVR